MVDTSKVQDRRKLRFQCIEDLLAEVDRVVAADRAGKLRRTGNWTAGQVLGHLATWLNYSYEGFPMRIPWFIRLLIRTQKKKYLRDGMEAGIHIPKAPGGTYGTEALSTAEGAERLRMVLARLKSGEPARYESPVWGTMSYEERVALNLRHAELHLGFLHI